MLSLASLAAELLRNQAPLSDGPRKLRFKKDDPFAFREHESLRGGTARACYLAGVPNSFTVLREVGLKHRNLVSIAEDPNIDETALAEALGVHLSEITRRRYPKAKSGKRHYFGLWLPANSIDIRNRRFAPEFLALNGFHHAAWELKFLPFCPETWNILQAYCNACKNEAPIPQGWTKTLADVTHCDTCGRSLAQQPVVRVDESLRPELQIIARLVTTDKVARGSVREILPAALHDCELQALLDVILGLAKHVLVQTDVAKELAQISRLHTACHAVTRWPHGLDDLPFSIPDSPVLTGLFQQYASLGAERVAPEHAAAFNRPNTAAQIVHSASVHELGDIIGLREATEVAGLTADVLRQIWSARLITRRYKTHGKKMLPAFEVGELSAFSKAWKAVTPARAVAHRFGLPTYAIEQCAALKLIIPSPLVLPHSGYAFTTEQIDRLTSYFAPNATEVPETAVSLREAMRQISGQLKPWGTLLNAICKGCLPAWILQGPDHKLTSRIQIDASSFESLLASRFHSDADCTRGLSEMIPQADALEILNCSATSAGILEGLNAQGVNPKLFRLDQVLQRAKEVVATSDIAARLQLDNTRAYHLLLKAKVPEIVPSGWERQAAFQLVTKTNALKAAQLALDI